MGVIENLFISLLSLSLSTSVVLLPVLLIEPLLKRRYPAKWRRLLWLLIAVKLVIPISIAFTAPPVQVPLTDAVTRPITGAPFLPVGALEADTAASTGGFAAGAAADAALSILQLAAVLWLSVTAVCLIAQTVSYLKFRRRVSVLSEAAPSRIMEAVSAEGSRMKLKRLPPVFICHVIQSPVLVGLIRPALYLPHKTYSDDELSLILRHELAHFSRYDIWYKLIFFMVSAVHWFNPLVWALARQAEKDLELSCDDMVVSGLDGGKRALYGQIILDGAYRGKRAAPVLSTQFGGSKRSMKERLKNLFDVRRKRRGIAVLCAVALAVTVFGSLIACSPRLQDGDTTPDVKSPAPRQSPSPSPDIDVSPPPVSPSGGPALYAEMETVEHGGKTWYLVENESQLRSIAYDEETLSRNYIQREHIELSGEWTPIGDDEHPFTGTYTGDGYHISGLKLAKGGGRRAGLFGHVENGVVYNVTLLHPELSSPNAGLEIDVVASASNSVAVSNLVLTGQKPAQSGSAPMVAWDTVAVRYYEDGTPYIKDNFTNHTEKAILGYSYAMLAYDAEGNPLELDWYEYDSSAAPAYLNICEIDADRGPESSYYVAPGGTLDVRGGWTIGGAVDSGGNCTVSYVAVCFIDITFEDGETWQNPAYESWRSSHTGKAVDIEALQGYYPFVQRIS